MGVSEVIADVGTDAPGSDDETAEDPAADVRPEDPFSMGWETDEYELGADEADQLIGLLIAVTNLL